MNYLELKKDLIANRIIVNDDQIELMHKFLDMLFEWNKNVNLTAIKNEEEAIEKHLFDSLLPSLLLDFNFKKIIDVGSGAGFPGIPLAIVYPTSEFILLEPINKKAKFLEAVVSSLGLTNVKVVIKRAEEFKEDRGVYDIAISRAVAKLNILLELSIPLIKVQGFFIAMKSSQASAEIEDSLLALKKLNASISRISQLNLPICGDFRENILIVKNEGTPLKYPRPYAQIVKRPL